MRISDWSSDVCSSDLSGIRRKRRRMFRPADFPDQRRTRHLLFVGIDIAVGRRQPQPFGRVRLQRRLYTPSPALAGGVGGGGKEGEGVEDVDDLVLQPDRKRTRLNSSHSCAYRMPPSARNKKN